ncbi:MAG: hypothetical protein GY847_40580, partial [Proteobacteria bacterium]|nr:hypothetical protein [Pseudomonadota bacterium]
MGHLIFISSYLGKIHAADQLIHNAKIYLSGMENMNSKEECRAWLLICSSFRYWASGDLMLAIELGHKAKNGLTRFKMYRLLPMYHQLMAVLYYYNGEFAKGLKEAKTGLEFIQKRGFKETSLGWLLAYAGANSIGLGKIEDAISYGEKCLKTFEHLQSPWGQGTAYHI